MSKIHMSLTDYLAGLSPEDIKSRSQAELLAQARQATHILVAEDSSSLCELLGFSLCDYFVHAVRNGQLAIDYLQSITFNPVGLGMM